MKKHIFLMSAVLTFSIFAMDCPAVKEKKDDNKIAQNQQNIIAQNLNPDETSSEENSSYETSSMEIDSSSADTKRKRGHVEEDVADSKNLAKKQKIEPENQQNDQTEELKNSKVESLKNLAAKKIADYLANPGAYPNFKFNPEILHQELKDDIVHNLYKYHSNKVWNVKSENISLLSIPYTMDKQAFSDENYYNRFGAYWLLRSLFNISNDEKFMTFWNSKNSLTVFNISKGACYDIKINEDIVLTCAKISENSKFIVTGYINGSAYLWDLESGRLLSCLNSGCGGVARIKISKNNRFVVLSYYGNDDSIVNIWDRQTDNVCAIDTPTGEYANIKLSSDDKFVLINDLNDGYTLIINMKSGKIIQEIPTLDEMEMICSRFYPISKIILNADQEGHLQAVDANSGKKIYSISECYFPMAVSKDEKFLISSDSKNKSLIVRDLSSGACLKIISCEIGGLIGFTKIEKIFNDSRFIIDHPLVQSGSEVWDLKSDSCFKKVEGRQPRMSTDKKLICVVNESGESFRTELLDIESWGQCLQSIKLPSNSLKEEPKLLISKNSKYVILFTYGLIHILAIDLTSDQIINKFYDRLKNLQYERNQINLA